MKDDKMRQEIQSAMDTCLSGVQPDSLLVQHILKNDKTTAKRKPSRTLVLAATFILVATAMVLIVGNVLLVGPDSRNAAQTQSTTAQEPTVDSDHYGWKEYLADEGRPPLLPTVQEILDSTQEQVYTISAPAGSNPDDPQKRPFTVYFTLQEQYADPYIAIISVHVTLPEEDNGILCIEQEDQKIDPVVAKRLGVSEELNWIDAAEQTNCTLYSVCVDLETTEELSPDRSYLSSKFGCYDRKYHEDGSLTVFRTLNLYGVADPLVFDLYFSVQPMNSGIPIYDYTEGVSYTWVEIPLCREPISTSLRYEYSGDQTISAQASIEHWITTTQPDRYQDVELTLHLTDVHADMTPVGLYVTAEFLADEDIRSYRYFEIKNIEPMILNTQGESLPMGLHDVIPANGIKYPTVVFTYLVNTDTFPESIIFELYNHSTDGDTTILSVPLTLSGDETVSQAENPVDMVGQSYELGGVTFTVLEQYADPYAAMVTLRAGMSEGEAGILSRYESTSTISAETADRLGVSQGITWAQAAKELDLPLYGVRALLYDPANSSNTPGLTRNEENSDGSVTIHATAFLTGDAGNLAESVKLRLMALKTDTENPSNQAERETKDITVPLHFETISETQRYTIPEGQTGSSRFRYDDWDEKSQRTVTHEVRLTFTPVAARADLTPAGVYVKVECRVAEENIERGLNFGLGMASTRILGTDGDVLPGDLTYSFPMAFPMDDSAWPMVTFTHMIDADSIPEAMTFELLNRNEAVLHVELKKE